MIDFFIKYEKTYVLCFNNNFIVTKNRYITLSLDKWLTISCVCFLQKYESIEVCEKNVFQVDLVKSQNETEFGFAVEAELAQSFERDDELRLYVSNVLPSSVAIQTGGF